MKKAKILIVEDDIITSTVIKEFLMRSDYDVCAVATNDDETYFNVEKYNPDLILMDIFLKNSIDGIEITQNIKKKYDIPVIYLTADSTEDTIARAKITEPFGYLLKPVDKKILITNVELTLRKHLSYTNKVLETLKKANDELEQKVIERTSELSRTNKSLKNEIRHRKMAEEALRKAERLATIGKMSAILAHEIRNPLNSIKINTDILFESLNLPENKMRRLQIIQKEVNRLDNLVKEVLLYSRLTNLVVTEFNIYNLVESIFNQIRATINEKNIKFINQVDKILIKADSEKLKQVFLNMILNSIDALNEKGIIQFYTESIERNFHIYIKDSGSGINNSEKLFEPFFTTKNFGTGLGLSISQNIIEQHNGAIKLVSTKEGETIFCITIPIKQ